MRRPDRLWTDRAACARNNADPSRVTPTLATCVGCWVRDDCLAAVMRAEDRGRVDHGIAGGLTRIERNSLRRLIQSGVVQVSY